MPLNAHLNTFAGSPLDRTAERRRDPLWLGERLQDPATRILAFWNGQPLVVGEEDAPRLANLEAAYAQELAEDDEQRLFLGCDAVGTAVFAIELGGLADPSQGVLAGRGAFRGLRELAAVMDGGESAMAATARAMFEWRARSRFCSVCGQPARIADGGWKRTCTACRTEHFPRTDPVVIMLPIRGERCLLGRQASWPAGRYSALAGFMEPGETIEEACAREIQEESGLKTRSVHYHLSQPWPFPTNLMIGLFAEVEDGEAAADQTELEAVTWLSRAEVRRALAGDFTISLPPPLAIAHHLIAHWAREG